jgi:DNA-3-methyladenine glycosylase II
MPRPRSARLGGMTTAREGQPASKVTHAEAARVLAGRDPVIARLLAETGPPRFGRPTESHFATLVRAIVYQQLAGNAAAAIHGRLIAAMDGDVQPERLIELSDEALRAVGLSRAKAVSLRDLSAKVLDGTVVLSPRGLSRESDEEIIERLSAVRGIGPWTAQMFLLFQLRRLDVWPTADLGIRRGYGLAWGIPMPTAKQLEPLGDPYRPFRSVASWYCWRAAELYGQAADSALTR